MIGLPKPKTWSESPLGEVAEIERASVTAQNIETGTKYVGLEHLDSEGRILAVQTVNNGDLASNKFAFGPKHILYGKLRPYLRKIVRPDFDGVCSTDILPIRATKIDRGYLFHYLRHPRVAEYATGRCEGANLPRISPSELEKFPVHFPPLPEQRRIADILDKADDIRRKQQVVGADLSSLREAVFLETFGDPMGNPKGWSCYPLGQLVRLQGGYAFKSEDYAADGVRLVKISNVHHEFLEWSDVDYLPADYKNKFSEFSLRVGDILLSLTRPIIQSQNSVKVARVSELDLPCLLNQRVGRFVIKNEGMLLNSYLLHFLYSTAFKRSVEKICSVSLQPNMSTRQVEEISIPLPPIELQRAFERALVRIESYQSRNRTIVEESGQLFHSLVQQAFWGEL